MSGTTECTICGRVLHEESDEIYYCDCGEVCCDHCWHGECCSLCDEED